MNHLKAKIYLLLQKQAKLIRSSGQFDEDWYLQKYPDVADAKFDAVRHYLQFGAKEGRDPGPKFSTRLYLEQNPDVAKLGINPLYHYVKWGMHEARDFPDPGAMIPPVDVETSPNAEQGVKAQSSEDVAKLVGFLLDEKGLLESQLRQVYEELAEYADEAALGVDFFLKEHELMDQLVKKDGKIVSLQRQVQKASETEQGLRGRLREAAETEQGLRDRQREAAETEQGLRDKLDKAINERDQQADLCSANKKFSEELTAQVETLSTTIRQLEFQIDERNHRQELLDQQIVRAEAQIDFIKDVLFKDKSLRTD